MLFWSVDHLRVRELPVKISSLHNNKPEEAKSNQKISSLQSIFFALPIKANKIFSVGCDYSS